MSMLDPHLDAPGRKVAAGPARRLRDALARAGLHDASVTALGADHMADGFRGRRDVTSRPTVQVDLDPGDARTLASILETIA